MDKLDNTDSENIDIRKVLVIAYYFPPMGLSGVQRTLKFVKYLPKYGWSPIVLTTGATNYYAFDDTLLEDLNYENDDDKKRLISIYRTDKDPLNPRNNKENKVVKYPNNRFAKMRQMATQSIFIPDSRILWKKYAVELGSKIIEENPDIKIIFATAPPFTDFLVANELSKKYGIPFVVDYRDLWLDNPHYFYPTPFHKQKARNMEKIILNRASKIIVITRSMKEKLISRYRFLSHNDIAIVSHGYDLEDFALFASVKPAPKKLVITHSGLFPDTRTPKYFLKALSLFLEQHPDARHKIEARFVGIMQEKHIKLITKAKLNDVTTIKGYLPHKEAVKNLLESDVLWMMIKNNIETPGRFFEYIGAAKPMLLCIPDGSIKQIAEESNAAFITKSNNVEEILRALNNIWDLWKSNYLPIPDANFVQKYDRFKLTKRLAREISLVAKE
jgi:hypothetical protein